jgi:hypothetical protein
VARWPASYGGARGGRWGPWVALGLAEEGCSRGERPGGRADGVAVTTAQGGNKQRLATTAAPDSGFKAGGSLPSPRRSPPLTAEYGAT